MKKYYKITILLVTLFMIITLAISGCQNPAKPNPPNDYNNMNNNTNNSTHDNIDNDTDYYSKFNPNIVEIPEKYMADDSITRANRLDDIITDMDEVNQATVVIVGNSALIGVDLLNDEDEGVFSEIERIVKTSDRRIGYTAITADEDLYTRIDNISKSVRRGDPLSNYSNEITRIVGAIEADR